MSKKAIKGRAQTGKRVGKLYGRTHGAMVFNETVGIKVTAKIDAAIKKNKE
jgi:hypothetical protein